MLPCAKCRARVGPREAPASRPEQAPRGGTGDDRIQAQGAARLLVRILATTPYCGRELRAATRHRDSPRPRQRVTGCLQSQPRTWSPHELTFAPDHDGEIEHPCSLPRRVRVAVHAAVYRDPKVAGRGAQGLFLYQRVDVSSCEI